MRARPFGIDIVVAGAEIGDDFEAREPRHEGAVDRVMHALGEDVDAGGDGPEIGREPCEERLGICGLP